MCVGDPPQGGKGWGVHAKTTTHLVRGVHHKLEAAFRMAEDRGGHGHLLLPRVFAENVAREASKGRLAF